MAVGCIAQRPEGGGSNGSVSEGRNSSSRSITHFAVRNGSLNMQLEGVLSQHSLHQKFMLVRFLTVRGLDKPSPLVLIAAD